MPGALRQTLKSSLEVMRPEKLKDTFAKPSLAKTSVLPKKIVSELNMLLGHFGAYFLTTLTACSGFA